MKLLGKLFAIVIVIFLCVYGYLYYQNNRETPAISRERITKSYESGVTWLLSHREDILRDGNPMLWWMLGESARISGDIRVQNLYDTFLQRFDRYAPDSVWQTFFKPQQFHGATFPESTYLDLVEYQQYFLYTLTCSAQLAREPFVVAQNDPQFCWRGSRIIRPACVTHQLMGYRMAQRNQCAIENLGENIAILQNTIEKQLRYDPRVVDVYVQRVLMLVDSGASVRVKPRWIERILDVQLSDGGWSDMQPVLTLSSSKTLVFDSKAVRVAAPRSNFHATAQGVLLTSLLLQAQQL